jgi:hypothetical protein
MIATVAAGCLLYSTYLQVRVNSVEFHFYYFFVLALNSRWDPTMRDYFEQNHVGMITDTIIRHQDVLSSQGWFVHMQRLWGPDDAEGFRQIVKRLIAKGNHYWWSGSL